MYHNFSVYLPKNLIFFFFFCFRLTRVQLHNYKLSTISIILLWPKILWVNELPGIGTKMFWTIFSGNTYIHELKIIRKYMPNCLIFIEYQVFASKTCCKHMSRSYWIPSCIHTCTKRAQSREKAIIFYDKNYNKFLPCIRHLGKYLREKSAIVFDGKCSYNYMFELFTFHISKSHFQITISIR